MRTIAQLGTFEVENYGDLLYPLVFNHLVKTRHPSASVKFFSLMSAVAPQGAGFATSAARSLFAPNAQPCSLIIGGGDILRTDSDVVAAHYAARSETSLTQLRHSIGALNIPSYVVRKSLPRLRANAFYAEQFQSRWMNYSAQGPFIIDPEELPSGSTTSYLSCGVPHEFVADEKKVISDVLTKAKFIYLRDEYSAEKMRRAGLGSRICVAPDLIVLLSDQFDRQQEASRGRKILSDLKVDTSRPILCFQSQPYPEFDPDQIVNQLRRYQKASSVQVALLPVGLCHGDQQFLRRIAEVSGGLFKYIDAPSVFDIISVIAASDVFVGTSLHGNITAFSFGIPHLFGPLPVDKIDGFLRIVDLPISLKIHSWKDLNEGLAMTVNLGREFFAQSACAAKEKVYLAVNELMETVFQ